jgi:flavin-dependent dehydrogenase
MTIAATTSIDAAMDQLWHAVVVGAGPAGSVAARELARCGRAVLLIDKSAFPRGKVCGCCLSGVALETLRSIGLGHVPAEQGAIPLKNINLAAGKSSAKLNLGRGVSLSRHRLDAALVEQAIAAGAHFLPETPVTRVWSEADLRCVKVRHSRPIRCRLVVAAHRMLRTSFNPVRSTWLVHGLVMSGWFG